MSYSNHCVWDNQKNRANIARHGISFEQAITIFDSEVLTLPSNRKGEKRELSIGLYEGEIIIAVAHADRSGRKRIISARPAKRKERALYEKKIRQTTYH